MTSSGSALAIAAALVVGACGGGSGVGSIGAVLGRDPETGALHVRGVPEGNAADKAGLIEGDQIVFVDGRDVRDLDVPALRKVLRGEPGSHVELTVLREGSVLRMRVQRSELVAPLAKKPEGEEVFSPDDPPESAAGRRE